MSYCLDVDKLSDIGFNDVCVASNRLMNETSWVITQKAMLTCCTESNYHITDYDCYIYCNITVSRSFLQHLLEEGSGYGDHTRIVCCLRWPELFTLAQQNRRLQTVNTVYRVYRSIELLHYLMGLRSYIWEFWEHRQNPQCLDCVTVRYQPSWPCASREPVGLVGDPCQARLKTRNPTVSP